MPVLAVVVIWMATFAAPELVQRHNPGWVRTLVGNHTTLANVLPPVPTTMTQAFALGRLFEKHLTLRVRYAH
jgi:hypothetical protein